MDEIGKSDDFLDFREDSQDFVAQNGKGLPYSRGATEAPEDRKSSKLNGLSHSHGFLSTVAPFDTIGMSGTDTLLKFQSRL